jgi:hypothetical protein
MNYKALRLTLIVIVAVAAMAEPPAATVTVTASTEAVASPTKQTVVIGSAGAVIAIHCTDLNCDSLTATLDAKPIDIKKTAVATDRTIDIPVASVSKAQSVVVIKSGTSRLARVFLKPDSDRHVPAKTATTVDAGNCEAVPNDNYEVLRNRAYFQVLQDGSILNQPGKAIDEDDRIVVQVFADPQDIDNLKVIRKSPTRTFNPFNPAGADTVLKVEAGAARLACKQFILADFAPGKGEVEISDKSTDPVTVTGVFDFKVNPLYTGILSYGPVWTRQLGDQTFSLVAKGDKKVILASEEGRRNILYSFNYTYFWHGRRDYEKGPAETLDRINPTIGFTKDHISDHALAGVSIDLGDFVFTGGVHFGHVTRLASTSNLEPGSEFAGAEADIPKSKRWESSPYVGVSVNLRAVAALLKALGK